MITRAVGLGKICLFRNYWSDLEQKQAKLGDSSWARLTTEMASWNSRIPLLHASLLKANEWKDGDDAQMTTVKQYNHQSVMKYYLNKSDLKTTKNKKQKKPIIKQKVRKMMINKRKITRCTTASERNKLLQAIASFISKELESKLLIVSDKYWVSGNNT